MHSPVLFLDFDGVLHPNLSMPGQRMVKAPLLADALSGLDVLIVISSSWRFHPRLGDMLAPWREDLRRRVIGVTADAHMGQHARWHEIDAYARTHGVTNWRALDDAVFDFPQACAELIACEGSQGLGLRQVAALKRWLGATSG